MAQDTTAFEEIAFKDLVRHTLLDMFEFGAHSFTGLDGPYFWNSIGIDFESPMPEMEIIEHANAVHAKKIYIAHTHPLSNDPSLSFYNVGIDPREKIAFGELTLPIGNMPSTGDVSLYSKLKNMPLYAGIELVGIVFSAGGIWEFDIPKVDKFDEKKLAQEYDKAFPVDPSRSFMHEWPARGKFPSYFMELQKPIIHQEDYQPSNTTLKKFEVDPSSYKDEILKAQKFYHKYGVELSFHPYSEFNIEPLEVMQATIIEWSKTFSKKGIS